METNESMSLDAIETMIEAQEETTWYPRTAGQADWCIKKILEAKATKKRIDDVADEEIEMIRTKKQRADEKYDREIEFFTAKLRQYFDTVPASDLKETKTQFKYPLLNGNLVFTKPKMEFVKDDATLVEYFETTKQEGLIKVEKKPAWGEFKKRLVVMDGNVVDSETGDIVSCVKAEESEGKFEVKG